MDGNFNGQAIPARQLKTDRNMWVVMLLTIVTCGIYGIIFYTSLAQDLNLIAQRDGKKTMNYCLVFFLLGPITCGIFTLIWMHGVSQRVGDTARARGINTEFGSGTFWLWNVLGSMICVGPFIYMHKLCQTMNAACENYNRMGN